MKPWLYFQSSKQEIKSSKSVRVKSMTLQRILVFVNQHHVTQNQSWNSTFDVGKKYFLKEWKNQIFITDPTCFIILAP